MTDEREEWGPWIEHDGKGCPCLGEYVEAEFALPSNHKDMMGKAEGIASDGISSWYWGNNGFTDIIRYRIRRPRALTQLRDMVENLPAPERERADT